MRWQPWHIIKGASSSKHGKASKPYFVFEYEYICIDVHLPIQALLNNNYPASEVTLVTKFVDQNGNLRIQFMGR